MPDNKLKPKYNCPKCGEPLYREKSYPGFKPGPYLVCKNDYCRGRIIEGGSYNRTVERFLSLERFEVCASASDMLPSRFYNLKSKRPVRSE